jgi:hypothetical protein
VEQSGVFWRECRPTGELTTWLGKELMQGAHGAKQDHDQIVTAGFTQVVEEQFVKQSGVFSCGTLL